MKIGLLSKLIAESERIVVFTGAGVSLESGVDLCAVWSEEDIYDFSDKNFLGNPESREKQWKLLSEKEYIIEAVPNQTHYTLAEMDKMGKLNCVITENIDNLLQKAGVSESKIIELYGNLSRAKCLSCGKIVPMKEILPKVKKEIDVPSCPDCSGLLKPDAVFFPDELSQETVRTAIDQSRNCDLFISVGSSLAAYPSVYLIGYAKNGGAKLVVVGVTPTLFDGDAVVVIQKNAGETMTGVMEKLRERIPS
jgi:NAD-dependent deacetylase